MSEIFQERFDGGHLSKAECRVVCVRCLHTIHFHEGEFLQPLRCLACADCPDFLQFEHPDEAPAEQPAD